MITFDDAYSIVIEAEKLIESIGFKLGRGSSYDRDNIAFTIISMNGSITDAAKEILKRGYINHEKIYGQYIYV